MRTLLTVLLFSLFAVGFVACDEGGDGSGDGGNGGIDPPPIIDPPPASTGEGVTSNHIRFNASGVTGDQVIEHGLGEVPRLIIFYWGKYDTPDTNLGTLDTLRGATGMGATDGARQWAGQSEAVFDADFLVSSKAFRDYGCIVFMSPDSGAELGEASFVTWDNTSFTINWSTAPNIETSIFALVLAGENWVAEVGTFINGAVSTETIPTVDSTGIWKGGLFYHNNEDVSQPSVWGSGFNLGFWHRDDSGASPVFVNKTKGYDGEAFSDDQAQHSSPDSSITVIDELGNIEFQGKVDGSAAGEINISWPVNPTNFFEIAYIVFHGEDVVISVGEETIVGGVSDITPLPEQLPKAIITIDDGHTNQDFHNQGDITFSLGMGESTSNDDGKQGVIYFGKEFVASNANINGFIAEDRIIQHGDIVNSTLLGDVVREGQPNTSDYFRLNADDASDFYFLSIGETK